MGDVIDMRTGRTVSSTPKHNYARKIALALNVITLELRGERFHLADNETLTHAVTRYFPPNTHLGHMLALLVGVAGNARFDEADREKALNAIDVLSHDVVCITNRAKNLSVADRNFLPGTVRAKAAKLFPLAFDKMGTTDNDPNDKPPLSTA